MNMRYQSPPRAACCSEPASRAGTPEPPSRLLLLQLPLPPPPLLLSLPLLLLLTLPPESGKRITSPFHLLFSLLPVPPTGRTSWQGSVQNAASGFRSWCWRGSEAGRVLAERPQLLHGVSSRVTPRRAFLAHPD